MGNIVANPSFAGASFWSFDTGGQLVAGGVAGAYCAQLYQAAGFLTPPAARQTGLDLVAGRTYSATVWVRSTAGGQGTLLFRVDRGDGNLWTVGSVASRADSWSRWTVGSFVALGTTGRVLLQVNGATDGYGWQIDLVDIDDPGVPVTTNDLRADLVTDLETVSGLTVIQHPGDRLNVDLPALFLRSPTSGTAEPASFSNRSGDATQRFAGELHLAGTDAEMDDLLDSIRNAVDGSSSTLNSRKDILHSIVDSWDFVVGSEYQTGEHHKLTLGFEIRYYFTRGAL